MRSASIVAGLACAFLLVWAPARAQDSSDAPDAARTAGGGGGAEDAPTAHDVAFRRAEIRERTLGDLPRAAELYLDAAREAPDTASRARAELRAASCLARTGEGERAEEIALRWTHDKTLSAELRRMAERIRGGIEEAQPAPAVAVPPTPDPHRVAKLEEELDQARLRLEQSLGQAEGTRQEMEAQAAELRAKEREIAKLRAQLPPPEPETAEEALRLRRLQLARQRREAVAISNAWTAWAARLHQDGRFVEAREVLYDALAKDPENTEAKALLARVAAPLGDRERLHMRIREVLALAQEVRAARMTAEVEYLTQQGRRLQDRGDFAGSVAPLESALALTASVLLSERGPARLRGEVEGLLRRAEGAGAVRSQVPAPAPEPLDEPWSAALRELLSVAGREIEQGLVLRFQDLDSLLPAQSVLLPPAPVTAPPEGFTLSTQGTDAGALIAAWLRGGEVTALAAPGASLDLVGSTAVVLADEATQERVQARISAVALTTAPAAEVEVAVLRASPGAFDERLRSRGLASRLLPGGARVSVIPPADVAAVLDDAGDGTIVPASRSTFRVAHLQPFRLTGGSAGRSITLDVLAVTAGDPGAALQAVTAWRPVGRHDAAVMTQRARAGAPLPAGGALALHGLTDPVQPSSDLVVVVRLGRRRAPVERADPPPRGPQTSATEHLLPRSIARVQELNAVLLPLPAYPIPTRGEALAARLRRAAGDDASLEVRGGRVLVVGPEAAQDDVRALIDRLAAVTGEQRFHVEAFVLPRDAERALIATLPTLTKDGAAVVASAVVPAAAMRAARRVLASSSAHSVTLTEPVVATPPTVRADAAHVVRTSYRRELDVAPGEATSWGRAETGTVDQGFVLALRPFGRDRRGRDELDVAMRVVRLAGVPARERETPLGAVELVEPHTDVVAADFTAVLAAADTLVIAGLPSPFGAADGTDRLVLLISPRR